MDKDDVPSSAFTKCWLSVTVAGVGVVFIPCSLAKSDFKRHNGNFKAKIYDTKVFFIYYLFS